MATQTLLTIEDLERLPPPENGIGYELSKGELIVLPMTNYDHDYVKNEIGWLLGTFVREQGLGMVFVESTFKTKNGPQARCGVRGNDQVGRDL